MQRRMLPIAGLLVATVVGPALAMEDFSGLNCLEHGKLAGYLDRAFGEGRVATGELESGAKIELFASRNGSWTLVQKRDDGFDCVQASGHDLTVERLNRPTWIGAPS